MAGEATHPDLINGSLVGILSELEQDKTFLKLAAGDIEDAARELRALSERMVSSR